MDLLVWVTLLHIGFIVLLDCCTSDYDNPSAHRWVDLHGNVVVRYHVEFA